MRIDQVRLFDLLKAYEKSSLDRNRRPGDDQALSPAARDEVILSTEAKRQQIFDRIRNQVIERLRSVPISRTPDSDVEKILAEVTDALEPDPLSAEERERIKPDGLRDLGRRTTSA